MGDKPSTEGLSNALYAMCATKPENHIFFQDDLLAFDIIPKKDLITLQSCTTTLASKGLFKVMQKEGRLCWRIVKKEDASKYRNFSTEEALIFSYVESASREGIWTRQIRAKTNLHPTVLNRYLKNLEKKRMIKATTNAKYPSRKTYILYNLVPSEEISGGCFYTDGKLDDEFIAALQKFAEHVIRTRSWVVEQAGGATLPPETGYKDYATLKDITRDFNESKVSNVSVREKEMLMVVDTLVWDGKVVRVMKGKAYKAVYPKMGMGDMENGLTQSPCGRCPVFDMCEEGGVVNAASCTYFQDWLALGEK